MKSHIFGLLWTKAFGCLVFSCLSFFDFRLLQLKKEQNRESFGCDGGREKKGDKDSREESDTG